MSPHEPRSWALACAAREAFEANPTLENGLRLRWCFMAWLRDYLPGQDVSDIEALHRNKVQAHLRQAAA